MAGGTDYKKRMEEYSKYKKGSIPDSDFSKYVDSQGDLSAAWKKIKANPEHPDSKYWIDRGATSKASFGRAHAAEDSALLSGEYRGATELDKGSDAWKDYFGDSTGTRFENYRDNPTPEVPEPWTQNPMLIPEYSAPKSIDSIPLDYQPWTQDYQEKYVPESLWNYTPPEFNVGRPTYVQPQTGLINVNRPEYQPAAKKVTKSTSGTGVDGAEGVDTDPIPWEQSLLAPLGYKLGLNYAGPGLTGISSKWQDVGSTYDDYEDTDEGFMSDVNSGIIDFSPDWGNIGT